MSWRLAIAVVKVLLLFGKTFSDSSAMVYFVSGGKYWFQ